MNSQIPQAKPQAKKKTVLLQGFWPHNPYLTLLSQHLNTCGLTVLLPSERIYPGSLYRRVMKDRPDIFHMDVLQAFYLSKTPASTIFKFLISYVQLLLLKSQNVKLVWTVHDLNSHSQTQQSLDELFTKMIAKIVDIVIVHGEKAKEVVCDKLSLPKEKVWIVHHGNFIDFYPNSITQSEARNKLSIHDPMFVYLFVGKIQPYKGVVELIDSYIKNKNENKLTSKSMLLIAGQLQEKAHSNLAQEIKNRISGREDILFSPGLVPDHELQLYFNAASIVVLPYQTVFTSGSAMLAMSFQKACIAPKMGCLEDMLKPEGAILYDPNDLNGLNQALHTAQTMTEDQVSRLGQFNFRKAEEWSWDYVASKTVKAYESCFL